MFSVETTEESAAVNLDDLLQEYHKWKSISQESFTERKKLEENQVEIARQYQLAQDNEKALLLEISQLKEIICNLQTALSKLCEVQDKNTELSRQVTSLENSVKHLKEEHDRQINKMQKCHQDTEHGLQQKIKDLENNHTLLMAQEINKHREDLKRKDEKIEMLLERIKYQEKESKDDLLKMRLQYEEKLMKLQDQKTKSMQSTGSVGSSPFNDIYRRKLQHLQQDYDSKIDKLNFTITELQEKLSKVTNLPQSTKKSLTTKRKKDFL